MLARGTGTGQQMIQAYLGPPCVPSVPVPVQQHQEILESSSECTPGLPAMEHKECSAAPTPTGSSGTAQLRHSPALALLPNTLGKTSLAQEFLACPKGGGENPLTGRGAAQPVLGHPLEHGEFCLPWQHTTAGEAPWFWG